MIPKGWELQSLEKVATLQRGKFSARPRNLPEYFDGRIPFAQTGDVANCGGYLRECSQFLSELGMTFSRTFPANTLLMTIAANVGDIALTTFETACTDSIVGITPRNDHDVNWLRFALQFRKSDLEALAPQNAQANLSLARLNPFLLLVPPNSEQQAISRVLVRWDRAIEFTEKLISAKQKRKQALVQQLLSGEIRLPAFSKRKTKKPSHIVRVPAAVRRGIYPPSVQPGIPKLIEKPDGWDKKTMAELLKTKKRRVQLDDDTEYDLVVAKRNRGGIEPRGKLRGEEIRTSTQFKVEAGDFVISRRQIIHGACGIVPESLDGAIVSNEYSVFTVNEHLDPGYLRLLSHSLYFQQTCFHSSVGVAVEKMIFKVEQWLKYPFLLPPIEEQRAITKTLETAEAEIALLQQRVEKLKRQKKGLMQQLLTGKTRVKLPKGAA
ncbi:restriction endonuclease subunit S [Gimesia maris]|uniref:restriction endonuclease subunit S n=1 Tax=Gimesia maris TaxID=122 RepID=UPI003A9485BD